MLAWRAQPPDGRPGRQAGITKASLHAEGPSVKATMQCQVLWPALLARHAEEGHAQVCMKVTGQGGRCVRVCA